MSIEITPNLNLQIPTQSTLPGSQDIPLNENLRKIDSAIGLLTSSDYGGSYIVKIRSTSGNAIPINNGNTDPHNIVTVLSARVFSSTLIDVTDSIPASSFVWTRNTMLQDTSYDVSWNAYYNLNRAKTINVTGLEINKGATFYCEISSF